MIVIVRKVDNNPNGRYDSYAYLSRNGYIIAAIDKLDNQVIALDGYEGIFNNEDGDLVPNYPFRADLRDIEFQTDLDNNYDRTRL